MTPTVGSLFSGIGGLELGFERAGFEIRWQVEIDPWCRKVLTKHWPDVPKYEDVRNVGKHNLEWVDVIVGGFPCQDISAAGKGAGLAGERSGLWREFARLITEIRPRYAIMENVDALLYRGLGRVLGDLAEVGYDAEWQILPACAFGAPHRRNRIFIVAYPQRLGWPAIQDKREPRALGSTEGQMGRSWGEQTTTPNDSRKTVAYPNGARLERRTVYRQRPDEWTTGPSGRAITGGWSAEPSVGRVANGIPRRVDRLRGLGNAVVPQVAQYVAECVKAHAEMEAIA